MDLSTIIGFVFCVAVVIAGILQGGTLAGFSDLPSFLIVVLGTLGAMAVAFPFPVLFSSSKVFDQSIDIYTPRSKNFVDHTTGNVQSCQKRRNTLLGRIYFNNG